MKELYEGEWGYAIVKDGVLWIPVISGNMSEILQDLYEKTGITKMIFSAILNPESFKLHLKNITREWDEWFDKLQDWSHCIEISYIPNTIANTHPSLNANPSD